MGRMLRWLIPVALVALLAVWLLRGRGADVEAGSVLALDLGGRYVEAHPSPLMQLLGGDSRSFLSLLSELAKAERDQRLDSVILRIQPLEIGWAKAQEIRDAIARISQAGGHTIAYLELEKFGANLEYYVASAADEVYMAPGARNPVVGLAGEYLFLGGLFEKLGVELEYERVGRYKSAVESYAERKMSPANREMTNALLDSVESQLLAGIAAGRGLSRDSVSEAIDAAPTSPDEMQKLGLIDGVLFFDELVESRGAGPLIDSEDYAAVSAASVGFDPELEVALVYGSGPVVNGEGTTSRWGDPVLAARTVSEAIEEASEEPGIAAILLRIDSPGGSALASDLVWHATQRARRAGKPVVASFSDLAASGGYYVACGADRVLAQPASLTGSIGVFVLRPVLSGLLDKLGVGVETMTRGAHADLLLSSRRLSPRTRARLRSDVQSVYGLFVERVAAGRSLESERVDAAGRGRVYTGAQAVEAGLVDELGGLRAALDAVKELLDVDPDTDVALVPYPKPEPLAEQVLGLLRSSAGRAVAELAPASPGGELLRVLQLLPTGAPLLIPPVLAEIR